MRIVVGNVIRIQDPSDEIKAWCHDYLEIPNPEYAKKVRMGFWVGKTPTMLSLYEIHGDEWILPFGTLRSISHLKGDAEIESKFISPDEVDYGNSIPLYDYQQEAVDFCYDCRYGILQSPAGSGKTQMGIGLIKKWKRKTLWLTHTQDLLKQSRDRALQYMDGSLIGTITEGQVNIGSGVTFATIQTMCRLDLQLYANEWDVIIVDECHRVAGSPTSMTQFYKVLNALYARHKYGLSATVHRSDGMIAATNALLGDVIYKVPDEEVADKIMQVGICPIGTGVQTSRECLNTDGTLNYAKLINYLCENKSRNTLILSYLIKEWEHPCLVLSDRIEHLNTLIGMLPKFMQEQSVTINGKMVTKQGKTEREAAIADMKSGKKKYLFATYALAKEGLDVPCLERLFMVTPQSDYAVVTQSIGRIARTAQNKQKPIAYDFVDDSRYLVNRYKKRCGTYKKNHCYFVEDKDDNASQ